MARPDPSANRYKVLIERVFFRHWKKGVMRFEFERIEIENFAEELAIILPKNIGDIIYSFRFRVALPDR